MKLKPLTDFEKAQRLKAQAILSAAAKVLTSEYGAEALALRARPLMLNINDPKATQGVGVLALTLNTAGVLTVKRDGQILARSLPMATTTPQLDITCKLPRWLA